MNGSNRKINTVDRIALTASFVAAVLIVVMFELTDKSALQPILAVARVAMWRDVGLPVSTQGRRMPAVSTTPGRI